MTPAPSTLAAAIGKITAQPRYAHSTWGIAVADLKSGEALFEQNGSKMFVPGSIFKTYSTTTVLDAYGTDYRFRTPVYRRGNLNEGILEGNLILVAAGDFSFGLREQKDGKLAYNSVPEIDHNYADTGLPGSRCSRAIRSRRSTSGRLRCVPQASVKCMGTW